MENNKTVHCKVIILDIEGTTTPISFVKDTLFPYVLENIEKHLDTNWDEEECIEDVKNLIDQAKSDASNKVDGIIAIPTDASIKEIKESIVSYVKTLVSKDRKVKPLKDLQGHMWRKAYQSGEIKGAVFPDVPEVLSHWYKEHIPVYIYSSGSVEAQKLLFRHSEYGDLLKYISGHFDTSVGHKRDPNSYKLIAKTIQVPSNEALFITDIPEESNAALSSGMQTIIIERPGNVTLSATQLKDYNVISTLHDVSVITDVTI